MVCWLEGEAWVETVLNKPEAPDFEHNIYAQFMPGAATFMHRLYQADYTVISSEKERKEPMTSTMMDSTVFRHIFSSEPMRQVFSDENRVQCYLDIEAALARVQARLDLIPQRAADEITAKCTLDIIDMAKLKSKTELIGYPVLPVVQQLVAACADHLGEYCHWGATSEDITDTATIMQIRQALTLIEDDLAAISGQLAATAIHRWPDAATCNRQSPSRS